MEEILFEEDFFWIKSIKNWIGTAFFPLAYYFMWKVVDLPSNLVTLIFHDGRSCEILLFRDLFPTRLIQDLMCYNKLSFVHSLVKWLNAIRVMGPSMNDIRVEVGFQKLESSYWKDSLVHE